MIVYLAWGSLYWDFPAIKIWRFSNLYLPLEFSRISDKGKGRLTLVIDEKNGTPNRVWYAEAPSKNVNQAINILRKREKTTVNNVAYVNLKNNKKRSINTPKRVVESIMKWAKINNIDAVIWTDLKSNWKDIMLTDYTPERAFHYFDRAPLDVRLKILDYVYKAKNLSKINTKFSNYFFTKLLKD